MKIEDEDSLYDFVRSRSENDLRFTSLFEFIYFEYLSVDRIENFASFASENLLEKINSGIWRQNRHHLILRTKPKEKNTRNCINSDTGKKGTTAESGREFVYDSKKLGGVIRHSTRRYGGNFHDKEIVNVTASNAYGIHRHQKNAVDLGSDSFYESKEEPNSWICYDFKEMRVIPTSYLVRSHVSRPGGYHRKSWVIKA